MVKPIFVLNGPNLDRLGAREPAIYGADTLADIEARCMAAAAAAGAKVVFRQTNHEGVLIDWVAEAGAAASALIINPAAYGHSSIALLDALKSITLPIVECHLSNPAARESFRRRSYVSLAATEIVSGFGAASYELAIAAALRLVGAARDAEH